MVTSKPLLIGMNSPQSERPEDALRVWSDASTGGRIYKMLSDAAIRHGECLRPTVDDYHERFERVNLIDSVTWNPRRASREGAPRVLEAMLGRASVVCGVATLKALRLERRDWCEWNPPCDENRYCMIPHPSGLNREYNDLRMQVRVGNLLYGLYSGRTFAELSGNLQ